MLDIELMMEAVIISETSITTHRLHGATSQETVVFSSFFISDMIIFQDVLKGEFHVSQSLPAVASYTG
jgi:hypothetical protein